MNPKLYWGRSVKGFAVLVTSSAIVGGALQLWRDTYVLSSLPPPPWLSFALFALAGSILWIALRQGKDSHQLQLPQDPGTDRPIAASFALHHFWQWVAVALSFALAGFVLFSLPALKEYDNHRIQTMGWATSVVLFGLAFTRTSRSRDSIPPSLRSKQSSVGVVLLVAATTALGIILRTARLSQIPSTLSGDEAAQGLEALRVLSGELANPFATAWRGVPTMSLNITALSVRLLGQTVFALRFPWALIGAATVPLAYWLVSHQLGRAMGLLAAILLAVYHYPLHFSRLGSTQIADAFLTVLGLLAVSHALEDGRPLSWIATGSIAGLSLYFYTGARFVPILLATVLACDFIRRPKEFLTAHGQGVALAGIAFLLVAAPMLQFALRTPDAFQRRIGDVGILQSGWIFQEPQRRQTSLAVVLADQFLRATLAFHYYPDRSGWYGLGQPLLDPLFGALLFVGLTYATLRALIPPREGRLLPFVIWWWGVMIFGGVLTVDPPSVQRLTALAVPACIFIALALTRIVSSARQVWRCLPANLIYVAAVSLFAAVSLTTYFGRYTPRRVFGGPYAELATAAAPELDRVGRTHSVYLVGAPYVFASFPTFHYLAPNVAIHDVVFSLQDATQQDVSHFHTPALFLIPAPRLQELPKLQAMFSDGTASMLTRPGSNVVIGGFLDVP